MYWIIAVLGIHHRSREEATRWRFDRVDLEGRIQHWCITITDPDWGASCAVRETWTTGWQVLSDKPVDLDGRQPAEWLAVRHHELHAAGWRLVDTSNHAVA